MKPTDTFLAFIKERYAIYERRKAGQPWPWTDDPILRAYRFCNVHRNNDTQTRLIHDHWLTPHSGERDLWFAMVVARLVNWWPSLQDIGYPVPWKPEKFKAAMSRRKLEREKLFTSAYMVRADAVVSGSKADYLADYTLKDLWEARALIRPRKGDTLAGFHTRLMQYRDMGSFLSAQVIADVKYAKGSPLSEATDKDDWAAPGPGSLRGLNVVLGRSPDFPWKKGEWETQFRLLQSVMRPLLKKAEVPFVDGQNLQNCLCEISKHARGYSRNKYAAS